MKQLFYYAALLSCITNPVFSQEDHILVIKGTVKCFTTNDERSTRGAKNVVVVPGFIPKKSGMTGTQGYYELNTGVPISMLEDKYVTIYFVSSCKQCTKKENVFISPDQA